MQIVDKDGNIFGNGLEVTGPDGKPKTTGGGGGSPTGPAGGDLYGTYPNPGVDWNLGISTYNMYFYPLTNPNGYISGITGPMVISALGYTPYDSTNPANYITSAALTPYLTIISAAGTYYPLTNPNGYISGITALDVTTALGYTPYDSSNPAGYLNAISGSMVTSALGYVPYDSSNPSGYISGITAFDITTALGYTPYDNANPAGYITSSALTPYLTSAAAASTYQTILVSGTSIKTVNSTSLLGSGDVAVQPTLVSGTNIKTVNSTSLLGSGDVAVQPTLVSGTNIKTVNSNSLLGSGNIAVQPTLTSGGNIRSINNQTLLTSGNLNIFQQLINTAGSVITGTTANSISTSTTIASTFLGTQSNLQLRVKILKTTGSSTTDVRLYINTTNSLSGATLIATAQQMTTAGSFQNFWRDIFINGSTMYFFPASTAASNDLTNYTAGTFTIAASTAYFFIVAIQHGNTTDSAQILRTQLFYAT